MKWKILRFSINHNDISLSLANGEEVFSELLESDIKALENNKIPTYWNEVEKQEGVYSCWIDWE